MPGNPELLFVSRLAEMAPGLPVILITGNPTLESAIGAVTLGVRAYLLKPYPAQELRREIEAAVSFRRLHTSLLALYGSLAADVPSHAELGIFLKAATYYGAALASSVDDPAIARAASRMVDLEPLLAVLRDAVAVIARSKGAFRSKDLGTLRRRLETVLARFEPPSVA
jgi:CheY-like chemotaxis protein